MCNVALNIHEFNCTFIVVASAGWSMLVQLPLQSHFESEVWILKDFILVCKWHQCGILCGCNVTMVQSTISCCASQSANEVPYIILSYLMIKSGTKRIIIVAFWSNQVRKELLLSPFDGDLVWWNRNADNNFSFRTCSLFQTLGHNPPVIIPDLGPIKGEWITSGTEKNSFKGVYSLPQKKMRAVCPTHKPKPKPKR